MGKKRGLSSEIYIGVIICVTGCCPTSPDRGAPNSKRAARVSTAAEPESLRAVDPRNVVLERLELNQRDPIQAVASLRRAGADVDWEPASVEAIQKDVPGNAEGGRPDRVTLTNVTVGTAVAIALDATPAQYGLTAWIAGGRVVIGKPERAGPVVLRAYDMADIAEEGRRWREQLRRRGITPNGGEPDVVAALEAFVQPTANRVSNTSGAASVRVGDALVVSATATVHERAAAWVAAFRDMPAMGHRRLPVDWTRLHDRVIADGRRGHAAGMDRPAPARRFENANLRSVLAELAAATGTELYLSASVSPGGSAESGPLVTVDWSGMTGVRALEATLEAADGDMTWRELEGRVYVIEQAWNVSACEVFDVRDLIERRAAKMDDEGLGADALVRAIQDRKDTGQWRGSGSPGGMMVVAGRLVVWQDLEGLKGIDRFLREERATRR